MAKKRQFSMMSDMMKRSNQGLKMIAMARARTGWFTPRNPSARLGRRSCDAVRRGGLRAGWVSGWSRETPRARGGTMASVARGTDRRSGKGEARDGRASPLGQTTTTRLIGVPVPRRGCLDMHRPSHAARVGIAGRARTSSPSSPYFANRDDAFDRKLRPESFDNPGVLPSLAARELAEMDCRS